MRKKWAGCCLAFLSTSASCSRVYIGHPPVAVAPPIEDAVVYVLGDFGVDSQSFREIVRSLKNDVEKDRVKPLLVAVGDNLYEAGLPRIGEQASGKGREAIERLASMTGLLSAVQFHDRPVPLVLVPGNHDYDGNALKTQRRLGDITRWYFPDELPASGA